MKKTRKLISVLLCVLFVALSLSVVSVAVQAAPADESIVAVDAGKVKKVDVETEDEGADVTPAEGGETEESTPSKGDLKLAKIMAKLAKVFMKLYSIFSKLFSFGK